MSAIDQNQFKSVRHTAKTYDVVRTTLRRRRAGIPSRRDCTPKLKKLTDLEESVIIQHILDLDMRGFSPKLSAVKDMANKLLAVRGKGKVGILWPSNFVKRSPELRTRFNRKYDYQRALNENPKIIQQWFERVQTVIAKYGIQEDDIFNFDETGFMMGIASTAKVVTASEKGYRPKAVQPGNREWATVIQGVNAKGWAIPPFIILAGQHHLSAWYSEELPGDWVISVSDTGWTTNELGFQWIQHFERHTRSSTTGGWRLLVIDGHESHNSLQFQDFCKENNIVTLCMPSHASHLLQPLDVGCFAPLKRAYGRQIEDMIRNGINHITKLEFLPAFRAAFEASFIQSNIQGGFRGAGLVPFDPEAVISKLDIQLQTPTPPPIEDAPWEPKTPSNTLELALQNKLIKEKIAHHQDSSPTAINEVVDQFLKGAHTMAHRLAILEAENTALRKATKLATQRKQRKKKRIQHQGSLTVQDGLGLVDQLAASTQISEEMHQRGVQPDGTTKRPRRCGRCREVGHRVDKCPIGRQDTVN
jgi:DDE superfamily endonuclease